MLDSAQIAQAMRVPPFHRHLMFARTDRLLQRQLSRKLEPWERQGRMPWPQREAIQRVERAIRDRAGDVLSILMSRQTGKNETEALVEARMLSAFHGIPESKYVRTAPTYRPQIVNSKQRLEKILMVDPVNRQLGGTRPREGFIYESGHAQVMFLSGGTQSNVVGATASIALSVDEAHKQDSGKFEEDLLPFVASTNAPTILWGVAADELDLLHEYRVLNDGTDRCLVYPWHIWAELSPFYAKHCEQRLRKLGDRHPVWLTQYCLVPVQSVGAYLNDAQRAALFSGDHPRMQAPRAGMAYAMLVDVGGESETEADDADVMAMEPGRDYTWAWIVEYDPKAQAEPYETVRLVNAHWYVGRSHESLIPTLEGVARHWGIRSGVIDARGVGEALAMALHKRLPCIEPYKATGESASVDCYDLLARLNCGTVQFWKADPTLDDIAAELSKEAQFCRYTIRGHELMNLAKPRGARTTGVHIDGMKALTYLHRVLGQSHAGLRAFMQAQGDTDAAE